MNCVVCGAELKEGDRVLPMGAPLGYQAWAHTRCADTIAISHQTLRADVPVRPPAEPINIPWGDGHLSISEDNQVE